MQGHFVHFLMTLLESCKLQWVCGVGFLNLVIAFLSLGMLQTEENSVTLEKVDQGEEMPLCGLVWFNVCVCVQFCLYKLTHIVLT